MPDEQKYIEFQSKIGITELKPIDRRLPVKYKVQGGEYSEKELQDLADTIMAILPAKPEAPKTGKRVKVAPPNNPRIDKEKCKACGIKEICALSAGGAIHEDCPQLKKEI